MSKRCSDSEDDTPPRPLKKRCNIKLKFKDDDGDDGNGEKGDDKNKEKENNGEDEEDEDDEEEDDEEDDDALFQYFLKPPPELVVIKKEVHTIADLIEIGKMYDPTKIYNIDVKILHDLVEPLTTLDTMIGMTAIKQEMVDHILFRVQDFDICNQMMMHTVIEGPPGTGKTEVARIIGRIYLAMGILRNKKFVKATRSQLIAGYLGQTAIATQKMIDAANGGVLFIDEVYSLGNAEKRDSFSKECIDTINENLTTKKTDFICIVAGYKEDIKDCFFAYNAGLERRFPIRFHIDEYDASELFSIFKKKVGENRWTMDESIKLAFLEKHHEKFKFFGGDMELLFNSCKRAHSRRVFATGDERKVLRQADIEKGYESFMEHKRDGKGGKEGKDDVWRTMYM
jgi:ATP-dependent 26S proteasome regulatory subunit